MRLYVRALCSDRLRRMRGDEGMTKPGVAALIVAVLALLVFLGFVAFSPLGTKMNGR